MDDLADRLRAWARSDIRASLCDEMSDMAHDAANEIERLREALYHADEGLNYLHLYDESKYKGQSE